MAGSALYIWRSSNIIATLSAGGIVDLLPPGGNPIRLTFPAANMLSEPSGENKLESSTRFYLGREGWSETGHVQRVRYREIYPGIDVVFVTQSGQLEYNFEIAPNADPSAIRIRYEGASVSIGRLGDLQIEAPGVTIAQPRPQASQKSGRLNPVACGYVLVNRHEVRLRTGAYDRSAALLIDPTLVFSTHAGGSGFDAIYGLATDAA